MSRRFEARRSCRVDRKASKVEEPVGRQAFQLLHIEVNPILSLETLEAQKSEIEIVHKVNLEVCGAIFVDFKP